MRSPAGKEHWTRGTFVEVTPHTRLVIDMHATNDAGAPLFRAYTEVDFSDALGGTQVDIVQTYTFIDPSIAAPMVAGARGCAPPSISWRKKFCACAVLPGQASVRLCMQRSIWNEPMMRPSRWSGRRNR